MTDKEAIEILKRDIDLIIFDGNTGEALNLGQIKARNELNYQSYKAYEKAIEALDKIGKYQWIDVKDRLPQKETYVLVCFEDGFIATVFFGEDFELWLDSGEPIAWMPLPEPYKKEVE